MHLSVFQTSAGGATWVSAAKDVSLDDGENRFLFPNGMGKISCDIRRVNADFP